MTAMSHARVTDIDNLHAKILLANINFQLVFRVCMQKEHVPSQKKILHGSGYLRQLKSIMKAPFSSDLGAWPDALKEPIKGSQTQPSAPRPGSYTSLCDWTHLKYHVEHKKNI